MVRFSGAEPGPDVAEDNLVGRREAIEKVAPDALAMGGAGGLDLLEAGVRQLGVQAPAVGGGSAPGHVALPREPVDQPGAAAAAEQHAVGDLRHAHAVLGRVVEEHEHLERRLRQPVLGVHLPVELTREQRVSLEQATPGGELVRGERGGQ
jgi:hypothetical protein